MTDAAVRADRTMPPREAAGAGLAFRLAGRELRGGVKGDSPTDPAIVPTTFRSDTLTIYPRRNLAQTEDVVEMTQPGLSQRGVGMQLDTATRNLRLLSQVKTRYEPSAAR